MAFYDPERSPLVSAFRARRAGELLILVGAVAILWGIGGMLQSWYTYSVAARSEGTVVSSKLIGRRHYPVIEYQVNGVAYRCRAGCERRSSEIVVGQQVGVLYKPARPADAYVDSFYERWGSQLETSVGGGLLAAFGMLIVRSAYANVRAGWRIWLRRLRQTTPGA